jgi:adenylosuccinate lyase
LPQQEKYATEKDIAKTKADEHLQGIGLKGQYGQENEKLKQFSRGKTQLNKADFIEFINSLAIPDSTKEELLKITPFNYTGV